MRPHEIGAEIRRRRLRRGWSLAEFARRAGTSAPTAHRYETGWRRFEVHTLEKLATALGCRLDLQLRDRPALAAGSPSPKELSKRLGRLFWERRLRPSDPDRYPAWVVRRVLEYGSLRDVRDLETYYGRGAFLDLVEGLHFDSRRTRDFWDAMLELEGRSCTTRFSRREAETSWTA